MTVLKIKQSVGQNGKNEKPDVIIVQSLLNRHMSASSKQLVVDGFYGLLTRAAIISFQHRAGLRVADGLVQPYGPTWCALTDTFKLRTVVLYSEHLLSDAWKWFQHIIPGWAEPKSPSSDHLTFVNWDTPSQPEPGKLCWGARVSSKFKAKVISICADLEVNPDYLMACMALETGRTFSPSIQNPNGATGLIQFIPQYAQAITGYTTAQLAAMSAVQQLDAVKTWFMPYKGKLATLMDTYMAIFSPAYVGKPPGFVAYAYPSQAYLQNSGFDKDKDGDITLSEISSTVSSIYQEGLQEKNYG